MPKKLMGGADPPLGSENHERIIQTPWAQRSMVPDRAFTPGSSNGGPPGLLPPHPPRTEAPKRSTSGNPSQYPKQQYRAKTESIPRDFSELRTDTSTDSLPLHTAPKLPLYPSPLPTPLRYDVLRPSSPSASKRQSAESSAELDIEAFSLLQYSEDGDSSKHDSDNDSLFTEAQPVLQEGPNGTPRRRVVCIEPQQPGPAYMGTVAANLQHASPSDPNLRSASDGSDKTGRSNQSRQTAESQRSTPSEALAEEARLRAQPSRYVPSRLRTPKIIQQKVYGSDRPKPLRWMPQLPCENATFPRQTDANGRSRNSLRTVWIRNTPGSANPLLSGMQPVPLFPEVALIVDEKRCNRWGQPECSMRTAIFAIIALALFPPLWLLLGSGFFDEILGVIPRRAKQIALVFGVAAFAGAIALSIVFALV